MIIFNVLVLHYVPRLGREPVPMRDDYARRTAESQVWVRAEQGELVGIVVLTERRESLQVHPWRQTDCPMAPAVSSVQVSRSGWPPFAAWTPLPRCFTPRWSWWSWWSWWSLPPMQGRMFVLGAGISAKHR